MKIRPVVTELFHVERRTDIMKLVVAFPNFANASIKVIILRSTFISMCGGEGGHVMVTALLTKKNTENVKIFCVRFSVSLIVLSKHLSRIYYIKNQQDATLAVFFYQSHPFVLPIQLVKYLRHTQQLILKFTQLSATRFKGDRNM